jgi:hypothetical protein
MNQSFSSSLDSSSTQSCNLDIPPYESELLYPLTVNTGFTIAPQEPTLVLTVVLGNQDSVDLTDTSEPPTPAPVTEDEIPIFSALPSQVFDDDGVAGTTLVLTTTFSSLDQAEISPAKIAATTTYQKSLHVFSTLGRRIKPLPIHTMFQHPFGYHLLVPLQDLL